VVSILFGFWLKRQFVQLLLLENKYRASLFNYPGIYGKMNCEME